MTDVVSKTHDGVVGPISPDRRATPPPSHDDAETQSLDSLQHGVDDIQEDHGEASGLPQRDPELARVPSGPAYSTFSRSTKILVIFMVCISSFVSPMSASIYFPALNAIAADMHVSISLINLTLTTYMIFQALGPVIFGDLGDIAGRRPAFVIAFLIYIVANIGLALQNNFAALLILRMLQSTGSGGTLALGYAVVADVAVSSERGKYMGFVGAAMNIGPALSPVIGGLLAQYLSWRAIFWFCMIYAAVWLIPYVLFVPETCRKVVGNGSIKPQGWNMTLVDYVRARRSEVSSTDRASKKLKIPFPNPLRTLRVLKEKDMGLILCFCTILYCLFSAATASLSTQMHTVYGLNDLEGGLCFLPYGVGCCFTALLQGVILDGNYRRNARKIGFTIDRKRGDDLSRFPIERARIEPIIPMLLVGCASVVAYGWVLQVRAPLAAPMVLLFVQGFTITGSFSILSTLLVDLNPTAPATAIAALNLMRCLVGAGVIAALEEMILAMGPGWCFTFWGLLGFVCMPSLAVILKWGPKWREARRQRMLKAKEKEAQKERERDGDGVMSSSKIG